MVLERGEAGDRLAADLEGRDAVGDPLLGLRDDREDGLTQPGESRALRFGQRFQVPVDLFRGHRAILSGRTVRLGGSSLRHRPVGGTSPGPAWRVASDASVGTPLGRSTGSPWMADRQCTSRGAGYPAIGKTPRNATRAAVLAHDGPRSDSGRSGDGSDVGRLRTVR